MTSILFTKVSESFSIQCQLVSEGGILDACFIVARFGSTTTDLDGFQKKTLIKEFSINRIDYELIKVPKVKSQIDSFYESLLTAYLDSCSYEWYSLSFEGESFEECFNILEIQRLLKLFK
jgi:hypothetical protein